MKSNWLWFVVAGLASVASPAASRGEDVYWSVPLSRLTLTEGVLPESNGWPSMPRWSFWPVMRPYAVLNGAGEIYMTSPTDEAISGGREGAALVAGRVPAGGEVTGRLYVPQTNFDGMVALRFKLTPADLQSTAESRSNFFFVKERYYRTLQTRGIPGTAWFRHEALEAAAGLGSTNSRGWPGGRFSRWWREGSLEDSYSLFSGGRALSENLQLDRALGESAAQEATIDLTNLTGITVAEMDWKALNSNSAPALDYLSRYLPADQHAVFFPSFPAMIRMLDEAESNGTPVLELYEPRSEDAGSRDRYQRQLCLGLNDLSRAFGPKVIRSVAFTGSDPYLRVGTDVAVLFEAVNADALKTYIAARQKAAGTAPGAREVTGTAAGISYSGVVTPDRSVSSYLAVISNVVIVANSPAGLERLLRVAGGKEAALSSQEDYRYFRGKYPLGDTNETAFVVLSDPTIRRWCGPRWRILDARRTRAAAVLADLEAQHLDALVAGKAAVGNLAVPFRLPDAGQFQLTPGGVVSSVYGSLEFMTPIVELPLEKVTASERTLYEQWRDNYQRNWRQVFDPIAIRFELASDRVRADLTVIPLILASDYGRILGFTTGASIAPGAGDPHTNALLQLVFAVNSQSQPVQDAGNFLGTMAPGLKANAFAWLGQSVSIYFDQDPLWEQLQSATNAGEFVESHFHELPLALRFEVKNPLALAGFLAAVRAFVDQSAPGLTSWQTLDENGQAYVKVSAQNPDPGGGGPKEYALYYAATPKALVITLKESMLKQALGRQAAAVSAGVPPWLGRSVCAVAERRFFQALEALLHDDYQRQLQVLAWNNIPILNEWKRRYPDKDPLAVEERFWGTRLLCPGGGKYVWNDQWQTMESTVFGHPGQPRAGTTPALLNVDSVRLGVTFENQGLSASGVLSRQPAK